MTLFWPEMIDKGNMIIAKMKINLKNRIIVFNVDEANI
jgi:hypothetical protein